MSLNATIDRIMPYAPGWSRTGTRSVIKLVERAQDELFDFDAPYMHYRSTDNKGFPPYLTTVSGTYRYEMTDANLSCDMTINIGGVARTIRARRIVSVFVDVSLGNANCGRRWIGSPFVYSFENPNRSSNERTECALIPVNLVPALESTLASLTFLEDPGATTDRFFVDFLWEPPRLTAETIPLVIPELFEEALEDYCIGKVQYRASGTYPETLTRFYKYWVPRFQETMGAGTETFNWETLPRI